MVSFAFIPHWFNGYSFVIFEFISAIVLFSIAFYAYKLYKFCKNKSYKDLAIAFGLIGIAFIAKILTNVIVYYKILETQDFGLFTLTFQSLQASQIFYIIGYFFYKFLILLGFYVFYLAITKSEENTLFTIFLIIVTSAFSNNAYYIFHITTLIFTGTIAHYYIKNYSKNKIKNTKLLAISFALIAFSQVLFTISQYTKYLYIGGELLQLAGYLVLLRVFMGLIKSGGSKNKKCLKSEQGLKSLTTS
ncbi:MAG: hypothetical protein WC413_00725 [Candidatus Nanoarchaeia archaeon]